MKMVDTSVGGWKKKQNSTISRGRKEKIETKAEKIFYPKKKNEK